MLLRLRPGLPATELESILRLAKELGCTVRFLDEASSLLEVTGVGRPADRSRFEDCPAVKQVLDAEDAPLLAERAAGRPDTQVRARAAAFGRGRASLIGGPCAVEDRERLLEIAAGVRRAGAALLRGGAYKPRTSPYSFQGLGERGLELLAEARALTGLGIVTEVLDPRDVGLVCQTADVLQIGSRSMSNTPLLIEAGRSGRPVLLKRGMSATLREFLYAAEYVLSQGAEQLILCERGVRGFDGTTRNLLDVGGVAWLKRTTHLPVIVDPSHAAGRADLVPALARAGLAAGADGLLVEVHSRPEEARSDGAQAVSVETFARIAADARAILALDGRGLSAPEPELASAAGERAR